MIKKYLKKVKYNLKRRVLMTSKRNNNVIQVVTKKINGEQNQVIISKSANLVNCVVEIKGHNNIVLISESVYINGVTFYIEGNNNRIELSDSVRFNRGGSLWIDDHFCEIRIGKDSTFEDVHMAITDPGVKIIVGEDCMFAYDIDIRAGDSHSILDAKTGKRLNLAENIEIGSHVWVASHVTILKGVHIKEDSVVATRSVVAKPFTKSGILIGGVPARELKDGITWNRQRI